MSVRSAVRDSRMTLPIMPKAPSSVNVASHPKCRHPAKATVRAAQSAVIPAKAGIHFAPVNNQWIAAFAGMTIDGVGPSNIDLRHAVTRNQCPIEGLEQWDFDTAALDGVGTASVKRAAGGRVQR